jgi:quercetin dioxygenase-like cupin family protein
MAEQSKRKRVGLSKSVEYLPGAFRTTLFFNEQSMLCHFRLKKGVVIPLHQHVAVQNGYVVAGRAKFVRKEGEDQFVEPGDGYLFQSNEVHGAEVLEDSEWIECFTPMRPEYVDE